MRHIQGYGTAPGGVIPRCHDSVSAFVSELDQSSSLLETLGADSIDPCLAHDLGAFGGCEQRRDRWGAVQPAGRSGRVLHRYLKAEGALVSLPSGERWTESPRMLWCDIEKAPAWSPAQLF